MNWKAKSKQFSDRSGSEALALSFTVCSDPHSHMIDNLSATLSQIRGEIMHEFSRIEYDLLSALDRFLESQPKRP
jgi:hypothetical protein